MRKLFVVLVSSLFLITGYAREIAPDNTGLLRDSLPATFRNPVINADVPDISVIRVGDDFYMISTTMHLMPGAPVMKSKDLVNWEMVGYVFGDNGHRLSVIIMANFMFSFLRITSLIRDIFTRQRIRQGNGNWYLVHHIFMMHLSSLMMTDGCIFFMRRERLQN